MLLGQSSVNLDSTWASSREVMHIRTLVQGTKPFMQGFYREFPAVKIFVKVFLSWLPTSQWGV